MRCCLAVAIVGLAMLLLGCSRGGTEASDPGATTTAEVATALPSERESSAPAQTRTTASCIFADLVGVVLIPDQRRVEILETNQEFAGDTGLPPTGTGKVIAALTPNGLTLGERCRDAPSPERDPAASDFTSPYPERYPTWLRCGITGSVLIHARVHRGGYRLTIGDRTKSTVHVTLLPKRRGNITYSYATCRRFAVNDNVIP